MPIWTMNYMVAPYFTNIVSVFSWLGQMQGCPSPGLSSGDQLGLLPADTPGSLCLGVELPGSYLVSGSQFLALDSHLGSLM